MMWTRRKFLDTLMKSGAVLPLMGRAEAAGLFHPRGSVTHDPVDVDKDSLQLLDDLERACFEFFWDEADPRTGLVRDRARAVGGDYRSQSSIAATGFGLTALCIGCERGYRVQPEILARVRSSLSFLANEAPHVHGFLYHFVGMEDGGRSGLSEVSPMDTAILLCGALTCGQYFQDDQVQRDAAALYRRVNWQWTLNGGDTFALDWTPEFGFNNIRWDTYCESLMMYLLAMGSPTYPIPATCWHRIRRPWVTFGNYRFLSSDAPLFIHQFSHAWFDFRGKRDDYADYFQNSVVATHAHREFCEELSSQFPCYSEDIWGITASDSSSGYVAWGGPPILGPIDGTIVPAAAGGSLPFVFDESVSVLKLLRDYYGDRIWRKYGFVDAFNPLTGWVSNDVLGIDLGISMVMAENARSQFVWDYFMRNPEVNTAMNKAGFRREVSAPVYAKGVPAQFLKEART